MTENSALQGSISYIKQSLVSADHLLHVHIDALITHAETAQKRIAELEAKMPEVVTVEKLMRGTMSVNLSKEFDLKMIAIKYPNGLRIVKEGE